MKKDDIILTCVGIGLSILFTGLFLLIKADGKQREEACIALYTNRPDPITKEWAYAWKKVCP